MFGALKTPIACDFKASIQLGIQLPDLNRRLWNVINFRQTLPVINSSLGVQRLF